MNSPTTVIQIVAAAVIIMLGLSGCTPSVTREQRAWLDEGRAAYERKDYTRAIRPLDRFLAEAPPGPDTPEALYLRGMARAQTGQRKDAYSDLHRSALLAAKNTELAWRTYVVLGTLYFEDEKWSAAAQSFRAALERMPEPPAPPRDHVLFRLGLCHERQGQWSAALRFYENLTRAFSSGPYVDAARRRLELRADYYAVQVGAYRTRSNADNLTADLGRKGLSAFVRQEIKNRTPMYIVLVGRFAGYDEARAQLEMIKSNFVPEAVLWP